MHAGSAGQGPVAMLDRCPHRAAALSEGRMTAGGNLQCAYHGAACAEQPLACMYCVPAIILHRLPVAANACRLDL